MSDLGSHWNDLPFWALKLKAPADGRGVRPAAAPGDRPGVDEATYEYGPRGDMPAVKLTWYQGESKPRALDGRRRSRSGATACLFVGDKGMLLADYGKHVLLPEKEFADFKRPEPTHPAVARATTPSGSTACKTGAPTPGNFEYAGWLTEANHLGNVAYRAGKKLEWDADEHAGARTPRRPTAFIRREYRKGWSLS